MVTLPGPQTRSGAGFQCPSRRHLQQPHSEENPLTNYTVSIPVSPTSQYGTLPLEIVANETSSTGPLTEIHFNGTVSGYLEANITYDMIRGSTLAGISDPITYETSHYSFGVNGSITLSLSVVSAGVKDPTFLWLPTDNGTVNGLPAGLERYTGEQSFDLVLVNASMAVTSVAIHEPWGGSYTLTLQPGLNNLLIPREQFLNSSFGEAILEGHSPWVASNTSTGWILAQDSAAKSTLTADFGSGAGPMYELGAYWQNRSIGSGSGNFSSVSEKGTPSTSVHQSALALTVAAANTTLSNNSGGVPSDPDLYSSGDLSNPPALQSIVTLNVTSQATLDLLIAALLDNVTGGVNGTFQTDTTVVASLGLVGSVTNALANSPILGSGIYGAPTYQGPPPSNSGGLWGDIVNSVSDVVQGLNSAFDSVLSVVWTATEAALTYLDYLAIEAAAIGGKLLARTASTIVSVSRELYSALLNTLDFVWSLILQAVAAAVKPISSEFWGALDQWATGLFSATNSSVSAFQGAQGAESRAISQLGAVLATPLLLAATLGVVIEVALGVSAPLDIAAGTLAGVLFPLVVKLFDAIVSTTSTSGWLGKLYSNLDYSSLLSVAAFDRLSQWLFNETQDIDSVTVADWIDPPGDFWTLLGTIFGGSALISGFVALYSSQAADSESDATGYSAIAFIFGIFSFVLILAESLVVSLFSGLVAHEAEFVLAGLGVLFGVLAMVAGSYGVASGGPDLAVGAGLVALILGGACIWAGYNDMTNLYSES